MSKRPKPPRCGQLSKDSKNQQVKCRMYPGHSDEHLASNGVGEEVRWPNESKSKAKRRGSNNDGLVAFGIFTMMGD